MAGHSKWENIKRQKQAQDRARAQVFSKLSKLITTAVKEGGSAEPDKNVQLRQAIDRAKEEDMPKDNIKRAIENAVRKEASAKEIVLEGYGPFGLAVLIKASTDNRQRTIQEIKNIFESNQGTLAEPGSVSYKFKRRGRVVLERPGEEAILELIDLGPVDIKDTGQKLNVFVAPENLKDFVKKVEKRFELIKVEIELVADNNLSFNSEQRKTIKDFLDRIKSHPDVEKVFTNE